MAAQTIDIKTGKPVEDQNKTHMTVTWQSVLALAALGLVVGILFAGTRKGENKGYLMYGATFAVFGAVAAAVVQVLDVKALKTKATAPVPADDATAAKGKAA